MIIGKYELNNEGKLIEIVESTTYDNWAEARSAAEALLLANQDNENVTNVFIGRETSPDSYIIKAVL